MADIRINRKLAAILAADVVGYSRLMEADEAGTLAALKRHREAIFGPAVAAHNGRIVKLIGDGTIVERGRCCKLRAFGATHRRHDAGSKRVATDHRAAHRYQSWRCHYRRRGYLWRWRQHRRALGTARRARGNLRLLDRQRERWQSDRCSLPGWRRNQRQEHRPANPGLEMAPQHDNT